MLFASPICHLPYLSFLKIFVLLFNYNCLPFLPILPPHPTGFMVWTSMLEDLWDSVVQSPWFLLLTRLGLSFMLALSMSLGFDCCWVFLWVVFSSRMLTESHSVCHVFYSVVQVWTGCVEADCSVCTWFWGLSLALVQLLFMGNFSTTY